jgi:hypothetical protein
LKPFLHGLGVTLALAAIACSPTGPARERTTGTGGGGASAQGEASTDGHGPPQTDASASTEIARPSGGDSGPSETGLGADATGTEGDAAGDLAEADRPTVTASCAGGAHPLCIDFEDGTVDPPWSLPASNANVEEGMAAHGRYAMHLSNLHAIPKNGSGQPQLYLRAAQMQGFKNVVWGRFYLYLDPGAPTGHGALVRVNDDKTNWHEVGFESNSYFGDWHTGVVGNPEQYERSKDVIPKATWACVEFFFDGAAPALPRVWGDGVEVVFDDIGGPATGLQKSGQFESFDIGIVFYHGGSLVSYGDDTPPYLTDEWIDDIALDTQRIGCL